MHNKTKIFRKAQRTADDGEEMVELGLKKTAHILPKCGIVAV